MIRFLMLIMVLVFCVFLSASYADDYTEIHGTDIYTVAEHRAAKKKLDHFRSSIENGGLVTLADRSQRSIGGIIRIASMNLKRRGHRALALRVESEWDARQDDLIVLALNLGRNIGDFDPLSDWLASTYDSIEEKLGYELCRILRLSDLKTLNYGLRVVFSPCRYGLSEFELHFIHDDRYRGVFPVVAYWTTSITCSIATFGAGYFFICSPIAMLVERGADQLVAPWLAPKIYSMACE